MEIFQVPGPEAAAGTSFLHQPELNELTKSVGVFYCYSQQKGSKGYFTWTKCAGLGPDVVTVPAGDADGPAGRGTVAVGGGEPGDTAAPTCGSESEPAAPGCACLGILRLRCRRSCEPTHPRRHGPAAVGVSNRIAFPFLLFVFISRT